MKSIPKSSKEIGPKNYAAISLVEDRENIVDGLNEVLVADGEIGVGNRLVGCRAIAVIPIAAQHNREIASHAARLTGRGRRSEAVARS